MKTVKYFDNTFQAELARGLLENEGIMAVVLNENLGSVMPYDTAIPSLRPYVAVADADLERAVELLSEADNEQIPSACPACGSANIGIGLKGRNGKRACKWGLLMLGLIAQPLPPDRLANVRYCRNCGHEME